MNVEELRSVQRTERQKDSLQHLRDSFYRDVADYIAERKEKREHVAASADDPYSSPDVKRITDEIETAEEVVESIYERRIGKIVKRATFAAAGMATEDEGLTAEERGLFDDLVDRIESNRETVLDTLAGEVVDDDPADAAADGRADEPEPGRVDPDPKLEARPDLGEASDVPDGAPDPDDLLAEAMGGDASDADAETTGDAPAPPAESPTTDGGDPVAPAAAPTGGDAVDAANTEPTPAPGSDTDRTTLRITRDVGEIFGVDEREYDLASEDVVTLPTPNAEPLLERDAAERLGE
jgi:DNA replication factor GINS